MKRQPEVEVIDKVVNLVNNIFPQEIKIALKEFSSLEEAQLVQDEISRRRAFLSWFLLERPTRIGFTPMEVANSLPFDSFKQKERKIIRNFLKHINSLFEIESVSLNNKEFILKNIVNNKKYKIETIDFPNILKKGEYIRTLIVKKVEGNYFFYGNVGIYEKEDGVKLKEEITKQLKEKNRRP